MRLKRRSIVVLIAILALSCVGCLRDALLNPDVAQGRIDELFDTYPDETSNWAHWFRISLDNWSGKK